MGSTQRPVAGSLLTFTGSRFETIMRLCRAGAPVVGGAAGAAPPSMAGGAWLCAVPRLLGGAAPGCKEPLERLTSAEELWRLTEKACSCDVSTLVQRETAGWCCGEAGVGSGCP